MILLAKEQIRKKSKKKSKEVIKPKIKIKPVSVSKKELKKIPKGKLWKEKPIKKPPKELKYPAPDKGANIFWNKLKKDGTRTIKPKGKEYVQSYNDYTKKGLIPIYMVSNSQSTSHIVPIVLTQLVDPVDYVAESTTKLSQIRKTGETTSGNQIQTKISPKGEFLGLYYQDGESTTPLPHLYKAKYIRADPDRIGMFQAWFINAYAWSKPSDHPLYNKEKGQIKNIVDEKGNVGYLDYVLAMQGLTGNIIDSKAYYRNGIVRKAIKQTFGDSSLAYIPLGSDTPEDLSCSDQQVRACGLIVQNKVDMVVKTPEFMISFDYQVKDFREKKPRLVFIPSKEQPDPSPLTSDQLLRIANRNLKLDALAIQSLLEALYQQNWISYPRADIIKAEDEPIRIKNPNTGQITESGKEARHLLKKEFKGSFHERQLLDIIVRSQESLEQKKNFFTKGQWHLVSGNLKLSSNKDIELMHGEATKFNSTQIDIEVGDRGILEEDLVDKLVEEQVATPSTRLSMLRELQEAGILSKRKGRFIVDRRGFYLSSLDKYYTDNGYQRSYYLKKNVSMVSDLATMAGYVQEFDSIQDEDILKIRKYLKTEVKSIIKGEHDLAYLDSF